jgi:NAD(P)-dependent dehydrogenase (short-subunit alcohol dehydrogenase family)
MSSPKAVLVIGAGDATGGTLAALRARGLHCLRHAAQRRQAAAAGRADPRRRRPGARLRQRRAQEMEMVALVEKIEREIAPIEVAVFNIGANVRLPITETTARVYFKVWEMACFRGFLMGREVAKAMLPRGRGTILFTGATASLRGREGFAAFAGAKHALRALAQSMARELWPKGIHVAHPVIDGAIDTEFIRSNFPDRDALKEQQGILDPGHIADVYWQIHQQPRDAWTHETELRPWLEAW